jgi:hypothetical protein
MRAHGNWPVLACGLCLALWGGLSAQAQDNASTAGVRVHVVITDAALRQDQELPPLKASDLTVKSGKRNLEITNVVPAQGESAALQLMILIDDTLNTSVGNSLTELKNFVKAQPKTTVIGIGYMSNAGVSIAQNFTEDHDLAANAIRLPRGSLSTMDSPYQSLISLVKGWPQQKVRRMVLMVSDGIDRLRGESPEAVRTGPRSFGPAYHSMPTMTADMDIASEVSQRYNVVVSSLYATGVGRAGRSGWDLQTGLSGLSKLADETGGECFSLGTSQLVSFQPHLERYQKLLANQYYVEFIIPPGKKAGLQQIKFKTELPNSEIFAPDNVWVPSVPK